MSLKRKRAAAYVTESCEKSARSLLGRRRTPGTRLRPILKFGTGALYRIHFPYFPRYFPFICEGWTQQEPWPDFRRRSAQRMYIRRPHKGENKLVLNCLVRGGHQGRAVSHAQKKLHKKSNLYIGGVTSAIKSAPRYGSCQCTTVWRRDSYKTRRT